MSDQELTRSEQVTEYMAKLAGYLTDFSKDQDSGGAMPTEKEEEEFNVMIRELSNLRFEPDYRGNSQLKIQTWTYERNEPLSHFMIEATTHEIFEEMTDEEQDELFMRSLDAASNCIGHYQTILHRIVKHHRDTIQERNEAAGKELTY